MIHISRSSRKPRKQRNLVPAPVPAPRSLLELDYPTGYGGQELSGDCVFISDLAGQAMTTKVVTPAHLLQQFAEEVALEQSDRAKQYLRAYSVGQRFLWTFADDDVAFLSLVVFYPTGPRTVMAVDTKDALCDAEGSLRYLTEFFVRCGIEFHVST